MNLKSIFYRIKTPVLKTFRRIFYLFGVFAFVMLILSFTDLPYYAYHNLATSIPELNGDPGLIVIPGGAGMPSPDGLIRTYYGAEAAMQFPKAEIIIALPYNEGTDSLYQLDLMAKELILKGVDSARIKYEPLGYNTHSQAVNIGKMNDVDKKSMSVLIVTTPEHMYRTVRTFQKAGFANVGGIPAFEKPVDEKKLENEKEMKDVNLSFRYNMWSYLNYELLVLREYTAIVYYKLRGWI
jgi:uncharacterized SAM-binding protein YcdF (DUF218 family)